MDADGRRRVATRRSATRVVQSFRIAIGAIVCAVFSVPPANADEIRFAARRDWQAWPLPGTVELTPQGGLKPIAARRDINAALNAAAFGGGIRAAGSNLRAAPLVMDGDLSTRWFVRRTIQAERDVFSHIVLDLGATYFVDKLKIVGGTATRRAQYSIQRPAISARCQRNFSD